jgi:hypothetical protein
MVWLVALLVKVSRDHVLANVHQRLDAILITRVKRKLISAEKHDKR